MKRPIGRIWILLGLSLLLGAGCKTPDRNLLFATRITGREIANLDFFPEGLGVAGAFSGVHNDVLLIAGGANFPKPIWGAVPKVYSDQIAALKKIKAADGSVSYQWQRVPLRLPHPVAYGASVSTDRGIVCIGGHNSQTAFADVFLLSWDPKTDRPQLRPLPSLPHPLTLCAAVSTAAEWNRAWVHVVGGSTSEQVEDSVETGFSLKLSTAAVGGSPKEGVPSTGSGWQPFGETGLIPGGERSVPIAAWQHDGKEPCLFVFSGRRAAPTETGTADLTGAPALVQTPSAAPQTGEKPLYPYGMEFLRDGWKWIPSQKKWVELQPLPVPMMAGAAWTWGLNHLFVLGYDNGVDMAKTFRGEMTQEERRPFPTVGYAYHTVTDTWCEVPDIPANRVHVMPVRWGKDSLSPMVMVPGEISPRIRATSVWLMEPELKETHFGALNYWVIALYLLGMLGVGVFFYLKDRKTDNVDLFFKGGNKIPYWVAAFSLFATMLSSITFVAIPGKAYATDWTNFLLTVSMVVVTPFVIRYFLPFFRRIKSASAYEYLENRFNLASRSFAGFIFMLYHILRMGIVMYLPALALASILKMSPDPTVNMILSILIMGVLSVVYCSLGGLSAVVWTDTIQSFVLLSAAFLTVFIVFAKVGGVGSFFSTANAAGKFDLAIPDFSAGSFRNPVLWVLLLGGIGQNLIPYASDQSIIQRYMSVKDTKEAKKSIWTNAVLSIFASALFFLVGTSLFVFYKNFPSDLNPSMTKVDEIFPQFIVRELPMGVAGLVVAAILAAAQSTVSTSINSASAVLLSDFVIRFSKKKNPKKEMLISRIGSAAFGLFGTAFALVLVGLNNTSIWDSFLSMLGLVLGALCGLFLLGIFSKRANGLGAIFGIVLGVGTTLLSQQLGVHPYLFGVVNLAATPFWGYLFSLLFRLFRINGETDLALAQGKGARAFFTRWFYTQTGNGVLFSYRYHAKNNEKKAPASK